MDIMDRGKMKRFIAVFAVLAASLFVAAVPAANASVARPAVTYYTWVNGSTSGNIRYSDTRGLYIDSATNSTDLTQGTCDGAFCLQETTAGNCMSYNTTTGNIVNSSGCDSSHSDQMWGLDEIGGEYIWENQWINDNLVCSPKDDVILLSSNGSSNALQMYCIGDPVPNSSDWIREAG